MVVYRRYRFPAGTLVTGPNRLCEFQPSWCPMISAPMARDAAARALRKLRAAIAKAEGEE
jgi:hypothetical protein